MSDLPFSYRNVPVPPHIGPLTQDRRQLMAWCSGVDSALEHHAHRLGEFEGENAEPKETPSGPQPGDRIRGYASPVGYKTGVFREVEAKSFNNGDSAIRIEDDEGAWYLRGPTVRRVYTADSPEPPADVTVLRDSGDPEVFAVRTGVGWDWGPRPSAKQDSRSGFPWAAATNTAHGALLEFQEGDDD